VIPAWVEINQILNLEKYRSVRGADRSIRATFSNGGVGVSHLTAAKNRRNKQQCLDGGPTRTDAIVASQSQNS
jgi:hypothetical protein